MNIEIFNAIAPRYDMTNHVLSLGMHRGWRKKLLRYLPSQNELKILDLATGTGDLALLLAQDSRVQEVLAVDLAENMLKIGRKKARRASLSGKIQFMAGDALALDIPDKYFDVVTIAFGLRNFSNPMKALTEAFRVIKPGGRLIVLEFAIPRSFLQKHVHGFYLGIVVPWIGRLFTGNKKAYGHLSSTVRAFPYGERFGRILMQSGFYHVQKRELTMGTAMVYAGNKAAYL